MKEPGPIFRAVALALFAGLVLSGCVTPATGGWEPTRRWGFPAAGGGHGLRYAQGAPVASVDSPSATCRHSPSACLAAVGKEVASVGAVAQLVLEANVRAAIDKALEQCADKARSEVLLSHEGDFAALFPNAQECNQLAKNAQGRNVTWAMQLGLEMHAKARDCASTALSLLILGRFSLEQRYLYDRQTKRKRPVSAEEERLLEETGNQGELKGSLKPDVVIHSGDFLEVLAIYDFKFPCINIDTVSGWTRYPEGHPYQGFSQGQMYEEAFNQNPARVFPRLGVVR